ncbi:MBL fold metallo-hydrolase, partial [Bacteroidota bacterium]
MNKRIRLEFLGTGTSQGVPVIGCNCKVCTSDDKRNDRLRSSVIVSVNGVDLLIDTGPDFRQQMLRSEKKTVDAVLYTHEHMDHVVGLDDIRAINFSQRKNMPLYCSQEVEESLRRIFHYAFAKNKYPGAPMVTIEPISGQPFNVKGVNVIPIEVKHGKMPVYG